MQGCETPRLISQQQNTTSNFQSHNKTLPPTPPTQKKILTNILKNASEKPTRASEMPTPALHKTYFV